MKKVKNLLPAIAAVLFAALLLTGCQQFMGSQRPVTVDDNSLSGLQRVTMNVTNYGDYASNDGSRAARSIFPDIWGKDDLVWYLYGTADDGDLIEKQAISLTSADGKSGTASLEIGAKNWDLILAGFPNAGAAPASINDVYSTAYILGRTFVPVSRWSSKAVFTLSTDNLKTPADVSVDIILPSEISATEWDFTAALYNEQDKAVTSPATLDFASVKDTTRTVTFAETSLTPGNYYLTVKLTKTDGSGDNAMEIGYQWSDSIHVIPGAATYPDQTIPSDLIGGTPAAPATATATYVTDSANGNAFNVKINWADTATTEQFYEIEIAELAAKTAVPATKAAWGTPAVSTVYSGRESNGAVDFLRAANRVDGSVSANKTEAVLSLETGKFYAVRVRSANIDGRHSDWTYATISGFDTNDKYLNRFTLTYNKNGGTGTVAGIAGNAAVVQDYTYSDTVTLASGSSLLNGPNKFKEWRTSDGTTVTTWDAETYENVILYAVYSTDAVWTIFDPSSRDFATAATLSFKYADAALTSPYTTGKTGTNIFEVTVTETETAWDYEYLWLKVDGVTQPAVRCSGGTNSVSYDCSSLDVGNHQILIIAQTRNGRVRVSSSLTLKITN